MINLDWTLFVQMALFLAFTAYLNVFLIRPMGRYLARRRETIEGLRAASGEQDATLEKTRREYTHKIAEARDGILAQRTAARREVMEIQQSMIEEAKKEAHLEISAAETELGKEVGASRDSLRQESRSLAASIYEKILGRTFQS